MAIVVLLLFAVGVAGAVGFQIVQAEARLALQGQETARAFVLANGALQRFIGDQQAEVADSAVYEMGGGEAVVRSRKVSDLSAVEELYVIEAEGRFTDPRIAEVPATRTVRTYAILEKVPMGVLGGYNSSGDPYYHNDFQLTGYDQATSGCAWAGTDEAALVGGGDMYTSNYGMLDGDPVARNLGSTSAFLDSMDIDWDVLTDPTYEVDYEVTQSSDWPDFTTIPADTMPVIRVWIDGFALTNTQDGWGLIIVTGAPDFRSGFDWNGIILSGKNDRLIDDQNFRVNGMHIGGLAGSDGSVSVDDGGGFYYHSCNVIDAAVKLAHLEPVSGAWWEDLR